MTKLVGILNVTPDSFSDGGRHFSKDDAIAGIHTLIAQGADIIDIGAESTRPGAAVLTPNEEWARLDVLLEALPEGPMYSLDTRHAANARRALMVPGAGIGWINDVSGFDAAMVNTVKYADCKLVLMHSLSVPADKNVVLPESADVLQVLIEFAREKLAMFTEAGIAKERVIFDPGLGFGKTLAQSMAIVQGVERLREAGLPLFIGHSRKSFLAQVDSDKDKATLEVSRWLIGKNVEYLRVHDVAAHKGLV